MNSKACLLQHTPPHTHTHTLCLDLFIYFMNQPLCLGSQPGQEILAVICLQGGEDMEEVILYCSGPQI